MTQGTGLKKRNVVIANTITRAAQGLSLSEKRILFIGIAKLGGINGEVTVSAQEYADTYDVALNTAYTQLKSATASLLKRTLRWQVQDGKALGTLTCSWLQGYKYFDQEGHVKFMFSGYLYPHLFDLNKEFTKYQLQQACALRSVHSWRMLELLERMRSKNADPRSWLSITLEDFYLAMDSPESYKTTFGLLRKKVIEPAIAELQHKDDWIIDWEPIKTGRKITSLKFRYKKNPQGSLFVE